MDKIMTRTPWIISLIALVSVSCNELNMPNTQELSKTPRDNYSSPSLKESNKYLDEYQSKYGFSDMDFLKNMALNFPFENILHSASSDKKKASGDVQNRKEIKESATEAMPGSIDGKVKRNNHSANFRPAEISIMASTVVASLDDRNAYDFDNSTPENNIKRHFQKIYSYPSRKLMRKYKRNSYFSKDYLPQFTFTPIEQTVSPGTQVSLKCSAMGSPPPTISWIRDGRILSPSVRTHIGSFQSPAGEIISHVNITNVTPRLGGLFKCTAANVIGDVVYSARLNVYGEPFIRQMKNSTVPIGSSASVFCPIGGYPLPHATWKHEGKLILSNSRYNFPPNTTLLIKSIRKTDEGYYSCSVDGHPHQEMTSRMYLRVLKPPEIAHFTSLKDLEEKDKAQLTCVISSGDQPMTIDILKDGRHIQLGTQIEDKAISDFSSALLFHSLSEEHSGTYTCVATNPAASTNVSSIIKVKTSPRWMSQPIKSLSISEGSSLEIGCRVTGYPFPIFTWKKLQGADPDKVDILHKDESGISKAANGSLMISSVRKNDEGEYMCNASNGIGSPISNIVQVVVNVAPKMMSEGRKVRTNAGQIVQFKCKAAGDPPTIIHWKKDNNPIIESHKYTIDAPERSIDNSGGLPTVKSILKLHNVNSPDSGLFTCTATNSYGSKSSVFELSVLEPPSPPVGVTVTVVKSRSVKITWKVTRPAAITIQYKDNIPSSWLQNGRNISVGDWSTRHVISSLHPFTTYQVRLFAFNELGISPPSEVQTFKTSEEAPGSAPSEVVVIAKHSKSLTIRWKALDSNKIGNLRGYLVSFRRQNFDDKLQSIAVPAMQGNDVNEEYTIQQLEPDSLYEISVQAFNKVGFGPPSSPRIVVATENIVPDCPPTRVSCKSTNSIGLRIWWEPPILNCYPGQITAYSISAIYAQYVNKGSDSFLLNTTNLEKSIVSLPASTNVSISVMAYNSIGLGKPSNPIMCRTRDSVPSSPTSLRTYTKDDSSLVIAWKAPIGHTESITHYTVYFMQENQPTVKRKVLDANEKQPTTVILRNLQKGSIIQSWVTCSSDGGESAPTERKISRLIPAQNEMPIAVGSYAIIKTRDGESVTLICRSIGEKSTSLLWMVDGMVISNDETHHLLSSGDIHISGIMNKSTYTCKAQNAFGEDSLQYFIYPVRPPSPPDISIVSSNYDSIQFKIESTRNGGAPVNVYKIFYKQDLVDWEDILVRPLKHGKYMLFSIPDLRCGSFMHIYGVAVNAEGSSNPSKIIQTTTAGSKPRLPRSSDIIELNSTCVSLLLYAWLENGCWIKYWKIEYKGEADAWTMPRRTVLRNETDVAICDLQPASFYIFRLTAVSDAGMRTARYKISIRYPFNSFDDHVQELYAHQPMTFNQWMNVPLSLMLSCAAILVCSILVCLCVVLRHRAIKRTRDNSISRNDEKHSSIRKSSLNIDTKNQFSSMISLKGSRSPNQMIDSGETYEILPYAAANREGGCSLSCDLDCNELQPPHPKYEEASLHAEKRIRRKRRTKIISEKGPVKIELSPKRILPRYPHSSEQYNPPPYPKEIPFVLNGDEWMTDNSHIYGHIPSTYQHR